MENIKERNDIIEVGRELLETGLVARTWGNISARKDEDNFLVTPSGLDYITMKDEDIVEVNISTGEWKGLHNPSGERGVHKAAYKAFDDVNFVVHTHQIYATAIGLAGFDSLDITEEEEKRLGGIGFAAYGLPGTDKLTNAVEDALKAGNHIVMMIHHGVLICGKDREDAMERTRLLEEICERNVKRAIDSAKDSTVLNKKDDEISSNLSKTLADKYTHFAIVSSEELIKVANLGRSVKSQLDDISQMVGVKVKAVSPSKVVSALTRTNAVLVKGVGAIVTADNNDDVEALSVLMKKMGVVKLHTRAHRTEAVISFVDSIYMHHHYVTKYSKQKKS